MAGLGDFGQFLGDIAFPTAMQRMRQREAQGQVQQLLGQQGQQYQGGGQGMLADIPATGLLGGQIAPQEFGAKLMGIPGYEQVGAGMMKQFAPQPQGPAISQLDPSKFTPQSLQQFAQTQDYGVLQPLLGGGEKPTLSEIGVSGGMRQKALIDPYTGQATMVGSPYGGEGQKPATQAQLTAAGYAERMAGSEDIFGGLKQAGYDPASITERMRAGLPLIGNIAASPEFQQMQQAQSDWVRAKLRKESGAVIGEEEMEKEIETYFPQLGDSTEVIEQKRQARIRAQSGMQKQAGKAYGGQQNIVDFSQLGR